MYCTECGVKLDDDFRFCDQCGTEIEPVPKIKREEREEKITGRNEYIGEFIKTHFLLLLTVAFYTIVLSYSLISANFIGLLFFILAIQTFVVIFLLSGSGEAFLRNTVHKARDLLNDEREYLLPLFYEVYEEAIRRNPRINRNIQLHIIDDIDIEAYALGNTTIMISKGAMYSLTETEIKGVFAHEFAHISIHFTKMLVILQTSIWVVSAFLACYKVIARILHHMIAVRKEQYGSLTVKLTGFILNSLFVIPAFIFGYLISLGRRTNEFYADLYAMEIGYGEDLRYALIALGRIELTQNLSFMERLMSTHPPTPERIRRLENN